MELEELLSSFENMGYDWSLEYRKHKYEFTLIRISWLDGFDMPMERMTAIGITPKDAIRNLLQYLRGDYNAKR